MMNDLRDLYQEVIFDHYRQPRNFGRLAVVNRKAEGYNPLCGDRIKVYLRVNDGIIKDVSFEGMGCAIATASASLMTESLKGKPVDEALKLMRSFYNMVTGAVGNGNLGKLEALAGVREFPQRVKCATLAWHTLQAALENAADPVTTE